MNGRNRHIQYRKSVYRKRKIRTVILTLVAVLVILAVAFLVIGLLLGKQSETRNEGRGDKETTADTTPAQTIPSAVQGYPVLLETADSSTFFSRIEALSASGGSYASIPLNTANGRLLYRSDLAISLGLQGAQDRSVSVATACESVSSLPVTLGGIYYLTAFAEENDLLRSVRLSEEAAVIAEAMRDGMDEVLLVLPVWKDGQTAELIRLMENVRALAPKAILGVTLPPSAVSAENGAATVDLLSSHADFLALDATAYGAIDPAAYITETISGGGMRYYLLRYGMRVLIPSGTAAVSQDALIAAVRESGSESFQILS